MRMLALVFAILVITASPAFSQCPSIAVIGPKGLTYPGDDVEFRAALVGARSGLRFEWSVKGGTITRGGGTPQITVATDRNAGVSYVDAGVTVQGFPEGCKNVASNTARVAPAGVDPVLIDEYGKLPKNDERGRLDTFLSELADNPNNIGLVWLMIRPGERYGANNRRVQFILNHLRYRKFKQARIWFILENASNSVTKFYRYPQDVIDVFAGDNPPCKPCLIIKGGDLD